MILEEAQCVSSLISAVDDLLKLKVTFSKLKPSKVQGI